MPPCPDSALLEREGQRHPVHASSLPDARSRSSLGPPRVACLGCGVATGRLRPEPRRDVSVGQVRKRVILFTYLRFVRRARRTVESPAEECLLGRKARGARPTKGGPGPRRPAPLLPCPALAQEWKGRERTEVVLPAEGRSGGRGRGPRRVRQGPGPAEGGGSGGVVGQVGGGILGGVRARSRLRVRGRVGRPGRSVGVGGKILEVTVHRGCAPNPLHPWTELPGVRK